MSHISYRAEVDAYLEQIARNAEMIACRGDDDLSETAQDDATALVLELEATALRLADLRLASDHDWHRES